MAEREGRLNQLRRDHPLFFWGGLGMVLLLLGATAVVATRIPAYQTDAARLDAQMSETERQTRDRILDSRARRSELAVALLSREVRLRSMDQKGLHLAIDTEGSTLALRHGAATLREVPLRVGPDSVVRAPDGRTWRLIRALGERHLQEREVSPTVEIPEWVYIGRGEPVPPVEERRVEGALGRYVLRLDDGTEIYSAPESGPFAEGAVKPAAFEAAEEDLRAIFDAVRADAPVYIY